MHHGDQEDPGSNKRTQKYPFSQKKWGKVQGESTERLSSAATERHLERHYLQELKDTSNGIFWQRVEVAVVDEGGEGVPEAGRRHSVVESRAGADDEEEEELQREEDPALHW